MESINKFSVIAQIVHSAHRELCNLLGNTKIQEWSQLSDEQQKKITDSVIFRSENPHAFNPEFCYKEIEQKLPQVPIGSMFGSIVDGIHDKFE
jgi:hypothetical protein